MRRIRLRWSDDEWAWVAEVRVLGVWWKVVRARKADVPRGGTVAHALAGEFLRRLEKESR